MGDRLMSNADSPLYAAIDLGSNSFHMLLVRNAQGSMQTLAKIKRKVRLAAGFDDNSNLTEQAMQRGWDCLALFSERLQDIKPDHIRIVATAALRNAKNADIFIAKANRILGHPITIISGEQEANIIYQGVASTSGQEGKHLIIDIGGASTEIIIGVGSTIQAVTSQHIGCVTWLENHFKDNALTNANFNRAIKAAKQQLNSIADHYVSLGWDVCVGASGTIQALQEIMLTQGMDENITLDKLHILRKQAISFGHIDKLAINGLTIERAIVFPSGLAILIALFERLNIKSMTLSIGALREGLVYEMINTIPKKNITEHTIKSIQSRFMLDKAQAKNVTTMALCLFKQCGDTWIAEPIAKKLLIAAAMLHEIGLSIGFKNDGKHAAYILKNIELPGFTRPQKLLIAGLIRFYRGQLNALDTQNVLSTTSANRILRLLRLAVILCHRRNNHALPQVSITANGEILNLFFPEQWIANNALMASELIYETELQLTHDWPLIINEIEKK